MNELPEAAPELYRGFACEFLQAEADVRAQLIRELRTADNHHTVTALQFLIGRRFRQFNPRSDEHVPTDVLDAADEQRGTGLSPEQKREIIQRMLASPTAPVLELLAAAFRVASTPLIEALAAAGFHRAPLLAQENAEAGDADQEVVSL